MYFGSAVIILISIVIIVITTVAVAAIEVEAVLLVVIEILELLVLAAARPTNSAVSPIKLSEEHSEKALNESLNSETSESHWDSNCNALSAVMCRKKNLFSYACGKNETVFYFPKRLCKSLCKVCSDWLKTEVKLSC